MFFFLLFQKLKSWFSKIWAFIKKHWQLILLVIIVIAGAYAYRRREVDFIDDYRKIQDAHAQEIRKIQAAQDEERHRLEENQKHLQAALDAVKKQYDEAQKELDDRKKKEVDQIVHDYGNNPDELAKKLAEVGGFAVVIPPQ